MKLTKTEEQGLRLALSLAREGGQSGLTQLAEMEGFTTALVAKVLGMLRRGGVVRAVRGRNGGYGLTAPPSAINVGSVIRAMGSSVLHACFNSSSESCNEKCPHIDGCGLRPLLTTLEAQLDSYLESISLADLMGEESVVHGTVTGLWLSKELAATAAGGKS